MSGSANKAQPECAMIPVRNRVIENSVAIGASEIRSQAMLPRCSCLRVYSLLKRKAACIKGTICRGLEVRRSSERRKTAKEAASRGSQPI